jgi:hypothetical protein
MNNIVSIMKRDCIVKFKISFLVALCAVTITHAMPGATHGKDIKDSIGCGVATASDFSSISYELIDKPFRLDHLPRALNLTNSTGRIISFEGADGIHRTLFHWGWNNGPERHKPLQQFLKSKNLSSSQIMVVNKAISFEWAKRKFNASNKFHSLYKRFSARKLAPIAYDIHILGDVGGSGTDYMISKSELIDDLCRHVRTLKGSEALVSDVGKSRNAESALNKLRTQLPSVVKSNFKK